MGADYVGWRSCALQRELGPEGFLSKLKLRSYRRVIEERVPRERRAAVKVDVAVTGRGVKQLDYAGILAELGTFEQGCAECAQCPLGGGQPLGCYRYVTYPVDVSSEELLFEYFLSEVAVTDSLPNQLWRDLVCRVPSDSAWHTQRGEGGPLAERPQPVEGAFLWNGQSHRVDSAQLLASLFIPLEQPALVVAYAAFFQRFFAYLRARVGLKEDGHLELVVDGTGARELQRRAQARLDEVTAAASSRTLVELEQVGAMLLPAALQAVDAGWRVVVDG